MKAFILAAGEGTRMRPLTANIPKPLLPVAGKPFLQHSIEILRDAGIEEVVILVGWQSRKLKEYFGSGQDFGVRIDYLEQEKRLGTAHAIGMAKEKMEGEFLCLNGDVVLTGRSIEGIISTFHEKGSTAMALARVPDPSNFGVIEVEDGLVRRIVEKPERPRSDLINAGLFVFTPKIFEMIDRTEKSPRGEYEITDSLQMLSNEEDVHAYVLEENWIDMGHPWNLLDANEILMKDLKENIKGEVQKNVVIEGPVQVGEGAIVKNGAYIVGPVIIGKDSEIGPNCLIRGCTFVGDRCKVGAASEVKNSIVMDDSNVPHHNYVGDSIIGERCNLGSGTKVANLRLDGSNIHVTLKGKRVDTGRRKLGVIMGDDVKTGINASLDVGTIIGEGTSIGPGTLAKGFIAPNSRIH